MTLIKATSIPLWRLRRFSSEYKALRYSRNTANIRKMSNILVIHQPAINKDGVWRLIIAWWLTFLDVCLTWLQPLWFRHHRAGLWYCTTTSIIHVAVSWKYACLQGSCPQGNVMIIVSIDTGTHAHLGGLLARTAHINTHTSLAHYYESKNQLLLGCLVRLIMGSGVGDVSGLLLLLHRLVRSSVTSFFSASWLFGVRDFWNQMSHDVI